MDAAREPGTSLPSFIMSARHNQAARIFNIDVLTALIAILLPWTTTGVAIVGALWVVALLPSIELRPLLRSLARPISILPIALFALALIGTLWSDAAWSVRLHAVSPTAKLLILPLLFYHCARSLRGIWVFKAFLVSCIAMVLVSCLVAFYPELSAKLYFSRGEYQVATGIFVKNYIDQSQEFALCAVALVYPVMALWHAGKRTPAIVLAAVAVAFVLSMLFVVVSRTALVTIPIMLMVFALLHLQLRTTLIATAAAVLFAGAVWFASPALRHTVAKFYADYQQTSEQINPSGMGSRLEFWRKSLTFFTEKPLIGHGTGSTLGLFEKAGVGQIGYLAEVVGDPHNQTLNVAVQWGIVGVILLWALWLTHLALFRGDGMAAWVGLMVVVQNMLTSLLNSHLFDFHEGWMYVLGVGVAGGMVLRARAGAGTQGEM
jgi:O-antigen ligase